MTIVQSGQDQIGLHVWGLMVALVTISQDFFQSSLVWSNGVRQTCKTAVFPRISDALQKFWEARQSHSSPTVVQLDSRSRASPVRSNLHDSPVWSNPEMSSGQARRGSARGLRHRGSGRAQIFENLAPTGWAWANLRIFSGPAWAKVGPRLGQGRAEVGPRSSRVWAQVGPSSGPGWAGTQAQIEPDFMFLCRKRL